MGFHERIILHRLLGGVIESVLLHATLTSALILPSRRPPGSTNSTAHPPVAPELTPLHTPLSDAPLALNQSVYLAPGVSAFCCVS